MYKILHSLIFVSLFSVSMVSAQAANTSRIFFEQTAVTLAKNSVSVDLEYSFISAAVATGLRAGAFGGEVMINTASDSLTGFTNSSIGYKKSISKGFSGYGIISYFDMEAAAAAVTDFSLGVAYTKIAGDITLNINPELVTDDSGPAGPRGGKNTIFVKGSAAYMLSNKNTSIVAEVILNNNTLLERVINLGARWQPNKNITVDMIIYQDAGPIATTNGNTKGIPGYVIVNMLF